MYSLVLMSIDTPTILGIYKTHKSHNNNKLLLSVCINGKVSQTLPLLFSALFATNRIHTATYIHYLYYKYIVPLPLSISHDIASIESWGAYDCSLQNCLISCDWITSHDINTESLLQNYNSNTHFTQQDSELPIFLNPHHTSMQYVNNDLIIPLPCTLQEALCLLTCVHEIDGIYYLRGVGSLSAIKLTHVFLHSIALSNAIPLYATNSFYCNQNNEIKAFGNMSFFYDNTRNIQEPLTDSNLNDCITLARSIAPSKHLYLPYILRPQDFNESCTPLYMTPAL